MLSAIDPTKLTTAPHRIARRRWPDSAFTLVELLAVIAVISVLSALLLSALTRAEERAASIACLRRRSGFPPQANRKAPKQFVTRWEPAPSAADLANLQRLQRRAKLGLN